jgi:hypothetical protein
MAKVSEFPTEWYPVISSNIRQVAWVEEREDVGTLWVEFKGERRYRYRLVPRAVYEELIEAESVGTYFGGEIREVYGCERVDNPPNPQESSQ